MNREKFEELASVVRSAGRLYKVYEKKSDGYLNRMYALMKQCRVPSFNQGCVVAKSRYCGTIDTARKMLYSTLPYKRYTVSKDVSKDVSKGGSKK